MEEEIEFEDHDRFQGGTIFIFDDGIVDIEAPEWKEPDNFRFDLHQVVMGESLDRIAFRYYRDKVQNASQYWWLIAQANDIERPWDLSDWAGEKLVIPDIYQVKLNRP